MKTYLILLFLVGCTAQKPLSELQLAYAKCVNANAVGCDVMGTEIERRLDLRERRAVKHPCGKLIAFTDRWGRTYCVTHREAMRAIGL